MTTARDRIKSALRKIAVLGTGSSLDATEANDALSTLNSMLALWSIEGRMIYTETRETFNLTGAQSYTIGSGGDFDTVRPIKIINAFYTSSNLDEPLVIYNSDTYDAICDKSVQGDAQIIYMDGNYPLSRIFVYPVAQNGTLTLVSEKPLTSFATLDTVYAMPPEYEIAIDNNLAVLLAPEYEREASATIQRMANQSKMLIKIQNSKNNPPLSRLDLPVSEGERGRYYDVYRGY